MKKKKCKACNGQGVVWKLQLCPTCKGKGATKKEVKLAKSGTVFKILK